MSSTIQINNSGYLESEQIENWSAVYAKKTIADHRENAVLDHPDGSVGYDKLDGDVRSRLDIAQKDAKSALEIVKAASTSCMEVSGDALSTAISAEEIATQAKADAQAATLNSNTAEAVSRAALLASESASATAQAVQSQMAQKQDKELEWQLITDTTLTEDAAFKQTLPDNCVGLRVRILVPANTALPTGQMFPRSASTWIHGLYFTGYNANTAQDKIIMAEWTQEHGTWVYDCKVRTGAGNFNGSIIYSFMETTNKVYKYSLTAYPNLNELEYTGVFKAGTIIKVWGLIK